MKKLNIFLDLEETVIDDWFSCKFLEENIKFISKEIEKIKEKFKIKEIKLILFSAAVNDENDKKEFEKNIKEILEKKLLLKFEEIFIFNEENWKNLAFKEGIKVLEEDTIHDIFLFNLKEQIFHLIAKENEINILFDDTVENKIVNDFEEDFEKIKTIKISRKV